MAKLTVGYSGNTSYAKPTSLKINKNETIDVTARDDCQVCFDDHDIFTSDPKYKKASTTYQLKPKQDAEGDATYSVYAYDTDCQKQPLKKPLKVTYSIHVGS